MVLLSLALIGLVSALISGLTGLAGGVILLSALLFYFPLEVVIPLHALIQVLANLSRVIILRDSIDWKIWSAFNLLTIPAGIFGAYAVSFLPKEFMKGMVGLIVLMAAVYSMRSKSSPISTDSNTQVKTTRYIVLGAVSSGLGMVVGATGPLIAPFFMISGLKRERFIATKSGCQLTVQVIKTAIFFQYLNFAYLDYHQELILIVCGVLIGTWLAKKSLSYIRGAWLEVVIAVMLMILGSKMMIEALVS